jgi:hypothetical protein
MLAVLLPWADAALVWQLARGEIAGALGGRESLKCGRITSHHLKSDANDRHGDFTPAGWAKAPRQDRHRQLTIARANANRGHSSSQHVQV